MTRFNTSLTALAVISSLAFAAPAVADEVILASSSSDLYEISDRKCQEISMDWCTSLLTPGITLQRYITSRGILEDVVLQSNEWPREMLQEEIVVGKFFFVSFPAVSG